MVFKEKKSIMNEQNENESACPECGCEEFEELTGIGSSFGTGEEVRYACKSYGYYPRPKPKKNEKPRNGSSRR